MKLENVKIKKENDVIIAKYEFLLEYEGQQKQLRRDCFPLKFFYDRKSRLEDADREITKFEVMVDSIYKGSYAHKTRQYGSYIDIFETNIRGMPLSSFDDCKGINPPSNSMCSRIFYDKKHGGYKKPVIVVENKGTYFDKLLEFNSKVQDMNIKKSDKALKKLGELEELLRI